VLDRIGEGFTESLDAIGNFFVELFVFLIVALPYLVIIAVLVIAPILIIRARKKKAKKNQTPPPAPKD